MSAIAILLQVAALKPMDGDGAADTDATAPAATSAAAKQPAQAAAATSGIAASKGEARNSGVFFTTGGKDGKPEVKTEMIIEPVPEVRRGCCGSARGAGWVLGLPPLFTAGDAKPLLPQPLSLVPCRR